MRILLVEDEGGLADVIARNLRARGHEAAIAGTAEAALADLAEHLSHVLIIDINLPDLTGWEILRRLSPEQRAALRVVVISAAPIAQKRIDEFNPEVALQKPFPISALLRVLSSDAAAPAPAEQDAR